ncbi:SDR family oxidoreductase [Pelomonas sp. Root1444]|uniref:SDR family oxidoreductase n=1 Tax=Pelomonas sp. Root1444 TaxID=1736464 RepID=UPI000703A51C|nr:SDR family oxidoreductase [Pelomonas sp. Root1444]KQY88873.1 short-chain dehydrogenase [Pelomonas sp. Root1444]
MSTDDTLKTQREIQQRQDRADAAQAKSDEKGEAVQAGPRTQPVDLPAQHLEKPGVEADLELAPRFMAPDYRGSGKLQDFVALITGADSGIGRAVAVLFAREGADVAVCYHSSTEDAEETARCVEAEGRQCLLLQGDVKDSAWCDSAVAQVIARFGKLDVLVNNAAFQEHASSLEDLDDERIQETLDTNIGGYLRMARAALPHLKNGASIINTGSTTGLRGSPKLIDYSATKGAIHAMTKALASNLIDRGIRVNAVAPGPVWTPLNPADSPADKVAEFGKQTDMKRAAQPEELSPAYVFLASPACAGYITGIVLPVTGSVGAI